MSSVTIAIPFDKNDAQLLPQLLDRLAQEDAAIPILFLSMGAPATLEHLVREFAKTRPGVTLEEFTGSTLAQAWNLAITTTTTDYLLLMHPVIQPIEEQWIERLAAVLDADTGVASVAPMPLTPEGLVAHTGILYLRALPIPADVKVPQRWGKTLEQQAFKSLRDTCLLIRRNPEHLFDEALAYLQDYDWTLKRYQAGQRNLYIPSVSVRTFENGVLDATVHLPSLELFAENHGNLPGLDQLNDCGTYYGGRPGYCDFPSTEDWRADPAKSKGTKITCFLADHDGCGTYRVKNPMRGLILKGYDALFSTYNHQSFWDNADLIYLQRQCIEHVFEMLKSAKAAGKHVVYEIDDFFHGLDLSNPVTRSFVENPQWLRMMEKIIYWSDALIVSTPELAKQYGRFNPNTYVLPNHIDLGDIPQPILENTDGTVRIGWGGSSTHDADFPLVVESLTNIMEAYPQAQLVFLAHDFRYHFPNIPPDRMEWIPPTWGHEDPVHDYYININQARLDIGLAPLASTHFNQCKSDVRLVELGAWGIVPIASDVEPYRLFAKESQAYGKTVFLARSERDWEKYLRRLIESPELRREMGVAIQSYVAENRRIQLMADRLEEILLKVMAQPVRIPNHAEPVHSLYVPYLGVTCKKASEYQQRLQAAPAPMQAAA